MSTTKSTTSAVYGSFVPCLVAWVVGSQSCKGRNALLNIAESAPARRPCVFAEVRRREASGRIAFGSSGRLARRWNRAPSP
jgi:hypothetical protein